MSITLDLTSRVEERLREEARLLDLPLSEYVQMLLGELDGEDLEDDQEGMDDSKCALLQLEGLGAEIWQGIDAQEYVNELRREWGHLS